MIEHIISFYEEIKNLIFKYKFKQKGTKKYFFAIPIAYIADVGLNEKTN